ncbi:hypothetical protein DXG01_002748 [Tephrocybe rancida]|nr:hypothetical protein DXG01_002748 [Tephrocybe rancida]
MRRPTPSPKFCSPVSRSATSAPTDENAVPPSSKSPALSPVPSLKESRAREHDRQRLKKAAALLQRTARKTQLPVPGACWPTKAHTPHTGSVRGPGVRVDDNEEEQGVEENEVEWGDVTSPLSSRVADELGAIERPEVALSDLLISSSRKPRHSRVARDFEIVPALRSVIVLDDFSVPELDPDEPWEHVYASDASESPAPAPTPELSYAKIAALN